MHIDRKSKAKYYLEKDKKRWKVAESEVERNLGIWVSNELIWETQCKKTASKAMSILCMIIRIFPFVAVDGFKLQCYTMFILGRTWSSVFRLGRRISKETVWRRCMWQKKWFRKAKE